MIREDEHFKLRHWKKIDKKTFASDMTNLLKIKIKTRTMDEKYEFLKEVDRGSFVCFCSTEIHWVNDENKIYAIVEVNSLA